MCTCVCVKKTSPYLTLKKKVYQIYILSQYNHAHIKKYKCIE